MARLQGRIVINPKVLTDNRDALAIAYNEAYRMVMEANNFEPMAEPTEEQVQFFADTAYANDPLQLKRTITARIATYDDSVPNPTPEQYQDVVNMLEMVQQAGVIQNQEEEDVVSSTLEDMTEKAGQMEQLNPMGEGAMSQGAMGPGAMPEGAMPESAMPTDGAMPEGVEPAMLQQAVGGGLEQLGAQAADSGGNVTEDDLIDYLYNRELSIREAEANEPYRQKREANRELSSDIQDAIDAAKSDGIDIRRDDANRARTEYTQKADDIQARLERGEITRQEADIEYRNTITESMNKDLANDLADVQSQVDKEAARLQSARPNEMATEELRKRLETEKSLTMRPTDPNAPIVPAKNEGEEALEYLLQDSGQDMQGNATNEATDGIARQTSQNTPAPGTTAPETPAPETPAPETPAPDTPAPEPQQTKQQKWDFSGALGKMNAQSAGARSYTDASGKRITEYTPVEGLDAARAIRQSNNSASGRILRMADMAQKNGGVDYIVGRMNDEKTGAGVRKNIEKQLASFDSLRESYEAGGLIQYDKDGNVVNAPEGWKERIAAANMLREALGKQQATNSTPTAQGPVVASKKSVPRHIGPTVENAKNISAVSPLVPESSSAESSENSFVLPQFKGIGDRYIDASGVQLGKEDVNNAASVNRQQRLGNVSDSLSSLRNTLISRGSTQAEYDAERNKIVGQAADDIIDSEGFSKLADKAIENIRLRKPTSDTDTMIKGLVQKLGVKDKDDTKAIFDAVKQRLDERIGANKIFADARKRASTIASEATNRERSRQRVNTSPLEGIRGTLGGFPQRPIR